MSKNIAILGSTGVLGSKLIRYLNSTNFNVILISCYSNQIKLIKQKNKIKADKAIILNPESEIKYKNNLDYGELSLISFIKKKKIDIFYILNIGYETLNYIYYITKFQKNCTIAIANKEVLIAGGSLLVKSILNSGNYIIPLDSEHFSLLDIINNKSSYPPISINKIFITASGGPFYFKKRFDFNKVKLLDAVKHPIWKMGYKNSIDSSNLINKILEIFELSSLLNISIDKIDFIISPKAFIHSIVLFNDSRIVLNAFDNDMMIPMLKPLLTQKKITSSNKINNLLSDANNFELIKFDNRKFQIYEYLNKIKKFNHSQQILFMMLNSEVIDRFINYKVGYNDIIPFIMSNIDKISAKSKFKNITDILKFIKINDKIIKSL